MSNTMPVISIDATFFWQIINFIVLLFIINKYFRQPIAKLLKERKEMVENDIEEAKINKLNSKKLLKDAEKKLELSRKEANEIIKVAERKAEEQSETILQGARDSREKILKNAELEVLKMEYDAKAELNSQAKKLAAELAEKLIQEKIDKNQETSLIDDFIAEVGEDK